MADAVEPEAILPAGHAPPDSVSPSMAARAGVRGLSFAALHSHAVPTNALRTSDARTGSASRARAAAVAGSATAAGR